MSAEIGEEQGGPRSGFGGVRAAIRPAPARCPHRTCALAPQADGRGRRAGDPRAVRRHDID